MAGPLAFHDLSYGRMQYGGGASSGESLENPEECAFVAELYCRLRAAAPTLAGRVGVVAPYRAQARSIRREMRGRGVAVPEEVEVGTVDGFQGREKDVIILSATRAPMRAPDDAQSLGGAARAREKGGIGFLGDRRRLNVAASRARLSLWIVGHGATLRRNDDWAALLEAEGMAVRAYEACPFQPRRKRGRGRSRSRGSSVEGAPPAPEGTPVFHSPGYAGGKKPRPAKPPPDGEHRRQS